MDRVREAAGEAGAADQAGFMDTHGGAGDGFTGSQAQMGPDVRLQADNDWQGEQFAHIAARPAVCAMQLLTYGGVLQGGRGEYREQFLWTASAPQWVSPRVVSAQAESPHTMEAWGTHTLERGHRDN